ncbi:MAG: hypothetical protein ALECFALPRED_006739 [Alectoria fallacina]|uniref:Uncharacterized protein n=1 Tax=Alectoria fallacina TaxID=1903189 RepID=A0A8H3G3W2_9LECA|nr:MAG: hypothetical protein ALECFALPRED_006739 [Alectoria fallacina]
MASSLRSHTLATPNTSQSAIPPTSPQRVQDLDPSKKNHALALRSFHHPSCYVARKSCDLCSFLKPQCFVAPAVSPKCVMCIAGRDPRFHALCLPDTSNSDDDVDVLKKGPARRQKSPHLDTTSRAANTIETLPGNSKNVLDNGRKPAKTSELPAIISTSDIVPRNNTENKEVSSNTQHESRLGTQTKSNNKPETLVSNSPKRRRLGNNTDEAANERGQYRNAAEFSSALNSSVPPPLMVAPDLNKHPSSIPERCLPSTPRTSLNARKQNNTIL